MDVTLSNFENTLPEIYEAIDDCDFMAIDTEFTGLLDGPEARTTAFDTPEGYYLKLKNCTSEFLLVQVGLCTFKYDEARDTYSHKAFNFYAFPRIIGRFDNDVKFLCQSSSIHFLNNNGFDFNKLFKEGIPYLNSVTEKNLLEKLVVKYENLGESETSTKVPIPDELKLTVEMACSRIKEFLSPDNEETKLILEPCNAFVRKLIFQEANGRFSSKNFNLSTESINNSLVLVAQKNKSKAEMQKESFERDKNEILEAVGFSKVVRYIVKSKKLIVGHNMFLDVCHIVNRFCQPLPDSSDEFKKMTHTLFPRIIDTKYMCSADPFKSLIKSSKLEHLIEKLKHSSPFYFTESEPTNPQFGYSLDQKKEHEAGFDAYLTGLVFISLGSYLLHSDSQKNFIHDPRVLRQFENKIFIMRIVDYSYYDLIKEEPKPNRNHVFHITFPEEWRRENIVQLFQPYGDVTITWCNQTSAWVSLHQPELAKTVINELVHAGRKKYSLKCIPYTLCTWDEFMNDSSSPTSNPLSIRILKTFCEIINGDELRRVPSVPGRDATDDL